mmetsp:Transcript_68211/g.108229  ORF Transcript_68211/g.108229 Transcript_68211/m.108229 type:complete len:195 (-) Transcript_68211:106-690(-)
MPFICIGPVCIPWTCLPPIVYFLWKFIKPLLPKPAADWCEKRAKSASDACQPYIEKIPGFKKKKAGPDTEWTAQDDEKRQKGEVGEITSEKQFKALMEKSKAEDFKVVLFYTADFCKPCKKYKPDFTELAKSFPKHCFAYVDAEKQESWVSARPLPTFEVHVGGECKNDWTAGDVEKMNKTIKEELEQGTKKEN